MNTVEYRKIVSGEEARRKIIAGVNILANTVKSTLGPNGRTVMMERSKSPQITKDGVTVAHDIALGDPVARMGSQLIKEVANNANNQVGDGTTTATVITQALLSYLKNIDRRMTTSGIKAGMEAARDAIAEYISQTAIPVIGREDRDHYLEQICKISSNNDPEIPTKVMEAFSFIGDKGAMKVDLGRLHHTTVSKSEGMTFSCGMVHSIFANNDKKNQATLKNPYILMTDFNIDYVPGIQSLFEKARKEDRSILVIASDYTEAASASFFRMKDMWKVKVCCVKAPGFGNQRADMLEDISIMTGGYPVLKGTGRELEDIPNMDPEMLLGQAERVIVTMEDFTIINGKGGRDAIDGRVDVLKEKMDEEEDGYLKDQLAGRIAKLVHGVAVIYVGAETEPEAYEKMDRYVDAVKAVKAAVKSGIIPGGGLALLKAAHAIKAELNNPMSSTHDNSQKGEEFLLGFHSVMEAIQVPFLQILINAEIDPRPILDKIRNEGFSVGYNVRTKVYENFLNSGVIDPALVASVSVANAVSIVSTIMSTEHVIHNHVGEPENYESL